MLRTLPLEIWLQIIEEAGAAGEYDALEACAKANRGGLLEERAQRCIPDEMTFRTQEDVASINMRQRWKGPKEVRIEGGRQSGERRPIPHLATFASRLAGKWTNVKELTIERAEWRVHDLVLPSLILDLACLGIEHLRLYDITFPTILTFWRLVCGLPNLDTLGLCDVKFMKVEAPALSALRRSSSVNPSSLHLGELDTERPRSPTTCSAVLLAQTMTCFKKPSWERLSRLRFQDVKLPAAAVFGRLLGALPALQHLTIDGPCTFSQQGFDLAESAVHPETTSQICTLELGKDFSLCSDAQSVHHLVDILIQSGAIRRLGFIKACLSPSLHVPTSIDVALNRLVTHAGESLRELTLQVLPLDSIPLFKEAYVYGAPSTACCFDLSANTHLLRLVFNVEITNEDSPSVVPLLGILHHVTSVHMLELFFHVVVNADVAKLQTDLSLLDAPLFGEDFTRLQVEIRLPYRNKSMNSAIATVRSWFPNLRARHVL